MHSRVRRARYKETYLQNKKKSRNIRKEVLKIKIRKLHNILDTTLKKKHLSSSSIYSAFSSGDDLRMRVRKVKVPSPMGTV